MKAKELLDAGQLSAAITQLNQDVKARPGDTRLRTFLFELLCFAGDYVRAERQLDVISGQSAAAEIGVAAYRNILKGEATRSRVFSDGLAPEFMLPPPPYVRLHVDAINRLRDNRPNDAHTLLQEAAELRSAVGGRVDGQTFTNLQDADDLIAPVLEVLVQDTYAWIPFEQIAHVTISAPKSLRDLIWVPAHLDCRNGPVGDVFVPVRYVGSSEHADERIKLGRMTDWLGTNAGGVVRGIGQRTFFVDDGERAFLEVREIDFDMDEAKGSA